MAEKKTSSPRIRRTTILTGVTYAPVFFTPIRGRSLTQNFSRIEQKTIFDNHQIFKHLYIVELTLNIMKNLVGHSYDMHVESCQMMKALAAYRGMFVIQSCSLKPFMEKRMPWRL